MKLLKIFVSVITIFCITSSITIVQATNVTTDDIFSGAQSFLEAGESGNEVMDEDSLRKVSDIVYNIFLAVGIIAAVVVGLIIAIKMMIGSSTEKAETKELLIPYIVGCIVIFGAFGIWKLVVEVLNQTQ